MKKLMFSLLAICAVGVFSNGSYAADGNSKNKCDPSDFSVPAGAIMTIGTFENHFLEVYTKADLSESINKLDVGSEWVVIERNTRRSAVRSAESCLAAQTRAELKECEMVYVFDVMTVMSLLDYEMNVKNPKLYYIKSISCTRVKQACSSRGC